MRIKRKEGERQGGREEEKRMKEVVRRRMGRKEGER